MTVYQFVIAGSVIVILSYFYNLIAKRFNIPSVLLLIATGILIKQAMNYFGVMRINLFPVLELLGIIGLIMIVLEAALDLKLEKSKMPLIGKSAMVALLGLIVASVVAAFIIMLIIPDFTWMNALIYAVPLSILSSAIIIPSVSYLPDEKKEFSIYESTFSDIMGIMMFYFLISLAEPGSNGAAVGGFVISLFVTIIISIVASYGLIYVFQNIKTQVKTFLLIAILILLYAIGKQFHLSSLIIILIFGLVISNSQLLFPRFLKNAIKEVDVAKLYKDLHVVTAESAFIVRTFFFVIFGITIALSSLLSIKVILVSVLILVSIYALRFTMFQVFFGRDIYPQVYIAPRGLITVLLFFAIPVEMKNPEFDNGILLFVIIATSLVMTWAMIRASDKDVGDEVMEMLGKEGKDSEAAEKEAQKLSASSAPESSENPPSASAEQPEPGTT